MLYCCSAAAESVEAAGHARLAQGVVTELQIREWDNSTVVGTRKNSQAQTDTDESPMNFS